VKYLRVGFPLYGGKKGLGCTVVTARYSNLTDNKSLEVTGMHECDELGIALRGTQTRNTTRDIFWGLEVLGGYISRTKVFWKSVIFEKGNVTES